MKWSTRIAIFITSPILLLVVVHYYATRDAAPAHSYFGIPLGAIIAIVMVVFIVAVMSYVRGRYISALKTFDSSTPAYICIFERSANFQIITSTNGVLTIWGIKSRKLTPVKTWNLSEVQLIKTPVLISRSWASDGISIQTAQDSATRIAICSSRPGVLGFIRPTVSGQKLDSAIASLQAPQAASA